MSITIYKYSYHVDWDTVGVGIVYKTLGGGGGPGADIGVDLSNYYTKAELQVSGDSSVHFDNLTDAYHNNLLNIQEFSDNHEYQKQPG